MGSEQEQQPEHNQNADSAVEDVQEISPEEMSPFEIRKIIADAMYSKTTETRFILEYTECTDEITPKQLRTVRRGGLEEIDQFTRDKTNDMLYARRVTVITRKIASSDNTSSA